jgi:drug/metabolite transporter (DMT)-like permease
MSDGVSWHPGIGDPTFVGWLTVVAYAVAAVLCFREGATESGVRFKFWIGLGVLMVLLGINKQLDLQTWLTMTGRRLARSEGWYEERRRFQFWFIIAVALAGALAFAVTWRIVRAQGADLWLPLFGFFVLTCFVVIRAASFHHVDQLLHTRIEGFKMNWLLELGGIGVIIAGALRADDRFSCQPNGRSPLDR